MAMEIDQINRRNRITSSAVIAPDRQDLSPKSSRTEDHQIFKDEKDDENDESSDSGSMTLPLFMDGLPKNFATNPQLAAIASLLNDDEDVEEGDKYEGKANEENNANYDKRRNPQSNQRCLSRASKEHTVVRRHSRKSANTRNRRQRQRALPYPRQNDRKREEQASTKTTSVGEITLFMNLWKP